MNGLKNILILPKALKEFFDNMLNLSKIQKKSIVLWQWERKKWMSFKIKRGCQIEEN